MLFSLRYLFCLGPGDEEPENEGTHPTEEPKASQAPPPAANSLELELTEEKGKHLELEQECEKAKVEVDTLARAKGKLEDEFRKEVDRKDAVIQQLEKEVKEAQAKVSHLGSVNAFQQLTYRA